VSCGNAGTTSSTTSARTTIRATLQSALHYSLLASFLATRALLALTIESYVSKFHQTYASAFFERPSLSRLGEDAFSIAGASCLSVILNSACSRARQAFVENRSGSVDMPRSRCWLSAAGALEACLTRLRSGGICGAHLTAEQPLRLPRLTFFQKRTIFKFLLESTDGSPGAGNESLPLRSNFSLRMPRPGFGKQRGDSSRRSFRLA
jgi:hypothetical protein